MTDTLWAYLIGAHICFSWKLYFNFFHETPATVQKFHTHTKAINMTLMK